MEQLVIKNGNFYRGNEKIRPEIGNVKQIKCLKDYEKAKEKAAEGIEVRTDFETTITGTARFECVCGKNVFCELEDINFEDDEVFEHKERTCHSCGIKYVFEFNDDNDLVAIGK